MSTTTQPQALFDALGLKELEAEEQEELLLEINDLVFKGFMLRLIERMDDESRDAFKALMEQDPTQEEIQAFFDKNIPGADDAIRETMDDLTNDILAATGESQD